MRTRIPAAVALALLVPAVVFATPSARESVGAGSVRTAAFARVIGDDDCGRGHAWGCRRNRDDDRYDERRERDRHDRDRYDGDREDRDRSDRARYDGDRYERDRWERERWERARYERARYERERYEREQDAREREEWAYRHRDRRYSRYDRYPVACIQAGGRVIGAAVLTICIP